VKPPTSVDPEQHSVAVATAASRVAAQRLFRALGTAVFLSLLLAVLSAAIARADVPDAANCVADSNMVASPDGGFAYTVLVRDNSNYPIAGATVVLDFTSAPGIHLCGSQDTDLDGRLIGTSDANGSATFYIKGGGLTTGRVAVGTALDVIVEARLRTLDLDGDSDVDANDQAALNALLGTAGPAGDFDKNGIVDSADVAILNAHLGGNCASSPAFQQSWGAVKALYR
jgi:hypothetical protein